MALLDSKTLLQGVILVISLFVAHYAYRTTTIKVLHRRLAKQHGCGSAPRRDGICGLFGLDLVWKAYGDLKAHKALEAGAKRWSTVNARTYELDILFQHFIITIDPENVKTVLSLNFKSYGLEDLRKPMIPFLGEGIFSTDGEAWQHSRDMLRPNFAKTQVADLSLLEERFSDLVKIIPQDGTTIDLQPLFIRFTLDVATQFLFGTSTSSLSAEGSTAKTRAFAEAFDRCEKVLGGTEIGFVGFIASLFQIVGFESSYKKDCKTVHGKSKLLAYIGWSGSVTTPPNPV